MNFEQSMQIVDDEVDYSEACRLLGYAPSSTEMTMLDNPQFFSLDHAGRLWAPTRNGLQILVDDEWLNDEELRRKFTIAPLRRDVAGLVDVALENDRDGFEAREVLADMLEEENRLADADLIRGKAEIPLDTGYALMSLKGHA